MSRGSPTVGRFDSFVAPLDGAGMSERPSERLRALPSVDRLATAVARAEIDARRRELLADGDIDDDVDLVARAVSRLAPGAGRVLNATGIVLHTNLGRAPLAAEARAAIAAAATGYGALELDLLTGRRSRRGRRTDALLMALERGPGCPRGQQRGGGGAAGRGGAGRARPAGDRVPRRAGGDRRGPAHRRRRGAVGRGAGRGGEHQPDPRRGLRRRHRSRHRRRAAGPPIQLPDDGFVQRPALGELVALGVPVIDDLGSGALDPGRPVLGGEPDVRRSVTAGAALTCFSGDKLLGGPQAGIIVGAAEPVGACRAHPLARALRIDKLCLAGLEATLELHLDPATAGRIPVLEMLELAPERAHGPHPRTGAAHRGHGRGDARRRRRRGAAAARAAGPGRRAASRGPRVPTRWPPGCAAADQR